jgi:hypothetical protein
MYKVVRIITFLNVCKGVGLMCKKIKYKLKPVHCETQHMPETIL